MQQSWADIALWERVIPLVNPAGIVELGTYLGGLSTYLALQARQRGIDFWTFDNQARPALHNRMVKQAGVMRAFNRVDVFSDVGLASIRAIVDDARNHPLLFLCDDGNKPQELASFAPLLWPGDVVGVHDWGAEITNRDLRGVPRLEPLLHNEAGAVGSLLRFWRVTA
jgi:cephalosporin hydroxylase